MNTKIAVLVLPLCAALNGASNISPDLAAMLPTSPSQSGGAAQNKVEVIVKFKAPGFKGSAWMYGDVKTNYPSLPLIHMSLPPQAIRALANNPAVEYITPNRRVEKTLDITDATVNATIAQSYGYDGTGVGVAIVDSGVNPRPDLGNRLVYSESFVAGMDASDGYGHGTHVAGIVAASGAASTGPMFSRTFKGVAPNAKIINFRVLDATGRGNESDVIAAIQRAITLENQYNIRVLNLSLGRPIWESYQLDPLCQAAEAAWNAGIVVVAAAGNLGRDNSRYTHGYGTILAPGNDPYVITVGASNARGTKYISDDILASYSSKGPTAIDHVVKPDLIAPGNGIVSLLASPNCTLAVNYPKTRVQDPYYETGITGLSTDYMRLSGTSMAAPVVSGAAALLIQKTPTLTPDQVKARLMKTAAKIMPSYQTSIDAVTLAPYSLQGDIFAIGAGYLDVWAALQNNDLATLPALSPRAVYDSVSKTVSLVTGQGVIWGTGVVWSTGVIWGTSVFTGQLLGSNAVVWGSGVVWGLDDDPGFGVVWGTAVLPSSNPVALSDDGGDQ